MKRLLAQRWRLIAVIASIWAASLLFGLTRDGPAGYSDGLIGAIPVVIAAWLYGARGAVATMVIEAILNVGILGNVDLVLGRGGPTRTAVVVSDILEGAAVSFIAIAVAAVMSTRHRLTVALLTDAVTGLGNRQAFIGKVEKLMARSSAFMTIALLELPDFTELNDSFGNEIGDEVLRTVASRVAKVAGPTGFAAKDGRIRFAVVWPAQERPDEALARDLLAAVSAGVVVRGGMLQLRAHLGIGRWNLTGGESADDVIGAARRAVNRAEAEGREWRAGERMTVPEGANRLETLSELGNGIKGGELRLHYQPLVDLSSRALRGFEALVRWQHPTRGLLAPGEFIDLAEKSGLIVPLTEWVIGQAIRQSSAWSSQGLHTHISVNVGAKALTAAADLTQLVERLTRAHGVDPSALVIEVTETDVMSDPSRSIAILRSLKMLGVRIEVDDFGTGYSSLSYLRQFPLDGVKIDRSFIRGVLTDTTTAAIVRATIEMSHALGLEVIAEGIEDEATMLRLKAEGCDAAQGFFIARPMPAEFVPAWVEANIAGKAHADNEPMPARQDGTRGTVLVVDDEHRIRLTAHRILSANGFRVIHAATASEALQLYARHSEEIGVVLTDVFLSDWRGPELASRLRRITPQLPVVFMSGDPKADDIGNAPFLAKPFSKNQLVAEVAGAFAA